MTEETKKKSGLGRYLGNSAWIMSDNLISSGCGLIGLAFVARVLGPEEYGAYAYVFALAQIFSVLGQMGLGALLARELVDKPDEHPRTLGTATGMRGLGFLAGAIGILLYGLLLPEHSATEKQLFVVAAIYVLFSTIPIMFDGWFRSQVEARYSAMSGIVGNLTGSALKVVAVLAGGGVILVGAIQALSIMITSLFMIIFFKMRKGPRIRSWKFDPQRAREILAESGFVFLGSILAVIYLKVDLAMLRWWTDSETVGLYAISARISEVFYFVPQAIVATFVPKLVELRKSSMSIFDQRFQDLLRILALLAYVVLAGILLFGPVLMIAVFGESYRGAIPILMVHVMSLPFIFLRFAFSPWIVIVKFAQFSLISQGMGAALNVLLNIILIPQYGMMGAAIATLISYAGASYFALLLSARTRPVFWMMSTAFITPWKAVHSFRALQNGGKTS